MEERRWETAEKGALEVAKQETWTAADAEFLLQAQRASGMTMVAFAKRHGFMPQRLYRWSGKGKKGKVSTPGAGSFVPVRVVSSGQDGGRRGLEIVLGGRRSIRVGADFEASLLQRVVAALEGMPC